MSPNSLKSSAELLPGGQPEAEIVATDIPRTEVIAKRTAKIADQEIPFIKRVHDEIQRTDPESDDATTRYSDNLHVRSYLGQIGTRNDASKK